MNNNVVYRAAKALVAGGVTALRFNFRGVGASTGSHANGVGEEEDVRAALDFLRAQAPGLPIWIAGFSFGARVGLTVGARSDDVVKLFGIGLALDMFDYGFLTSCDKPKAIVQASHDEYGGRDEIEAAVAAMSEPKRLWIVDGATHLFPGHLDAFERAADEAVAYLAAAQLTAQSVRLDAAFVAAARIADDVRPLAMRRHGVAGDRWRLAHGAGAVGAAREARAAAERGALRSRGRRRTPSGSRAAPRRLLRWSSAAQGAGQGIAGQLTKIGSSAAAQPMNALPPLQPGQEFDAAVRARLARRLVEPRAERRARERRGNAGPATRCAGS